MNVKLCGEDVTLCSGFYACTILRVWAFIIAYSVTFIFRPNEATPTIFTLYRVIGLFIAMGRMRWMQVNYYSPLCSPVCLSLSTVNSYMSPKCSNIGRRSVSFKWCGICPTNNLAAPFGICELDAMVLVVVDVRPLFVFDSSDDNDTIDDDNDIDAVVVVAIAVMIISFGCMPFVVLFTESWCCRGPNELFWLCIAVISLWLLVCGSINGHDFIVWLADSIGDNVINIITHIFSHSHAFFFFDRPLALVCSIISHWSLWLH